MLILLFFVSIAPLIFLIARCRLHAFLSLLLVGLFYGILAGAPAALLSAEAESKRS